MELAHYLFEELQYFPLQGSQVQMFLQQVLHRVELSDLEVHLVLMVDVRTEHSDPYLRINDHTVLHHLCIF